MTEYATSGERAGDAGSDTARVASVAVARPTSWARAIALGFGVVAALAVLLLWCPHWFLTRLPMLSRSVRVGLATGWIAAVSVGLVWLAARVGIAPVEPR